MACYDGPFDPDFHLGKLTRGALAALGREYMIFGQLNDRVGMPLVGQRFGPKAMEEVAIDEWMGSSPIYTQRMRRCLRFEGDDVPTIMKGLQLDVGFAHQLFDITFGVESPTRGFFRLNSCGALLDVEPFGEQQVISMCHHMEDPTFDATAVATNPRARVRPLHRPPRRPADRVPHCHWRIEIDPAAEPVREIGLTGQVRQSRLARFPVVRPDDAEEGGWKDYAVPFDPGFQLEDLSHGALVGVCTELSFQSHLIVRAFMTTLARRFGEDAMREIALGQWIGSGWVVSERLRRAFDLPERGVESVLKVLQVHPALPPGYTKFRAQRLEAGWGQLRLEDCEALDEEEPRSWFALLDGDATPAIEAMARGVDPRARCVRATPPAGARHAWDLMVEDNVEPAAEPEEVAFARFSGASRIVLAPRRPLRM